MLDSVWTVSSHWPIKHTADCRMRRSHEPTEFEKNSPLTRSVAALLLLMIPSWPLTACKPSDGPPSCAVPFAQCTRIGPWCGCAALVKNLKKNLKQAHNGQYIHMRKSSHGSFARAVIFGQLASIGPQEYSGLPHETFAWPRIL